jgi:hypothetical protein
MDIKQLLIEAADEIESWGAYAHDYFQEKHDLKGSVQKFLDAAKQIGEPFAWMLTDNPSCIEFEHRDYHNGPEWTPLYLAPQPVQVPDGWKLVPVEMTHDMLNAADNVEIDFPEAEREGALTWEEIRELWKAMLAAAPQLEGK